MYLSIVVIVAAGHLPSLPAIRALARALVPKVAHGLRSGRVVDAVVAAALVVVGEGLVGAGRGQGGGHPQVAVGARVDAAGCGVERPQGAPVVRQQGHELLGQGAGERVVTQVEGPGRRHRDSML